MDATDETATNWCTAASRRLSVLQEAMIAAASGESVKKDLVLSWAAELAQLRLSLPASEQPATSHPSDDAVQPTSGLAPSIRPKPPQKAPPYLHIADRGKLEERHVVPQVSTAMATSTRHLTLCIVAVLESLMNTSHVDSIALAVPHRGMDDELRCLCRLSRGSDQLFGGSGVIRGANTLEHSCLQTGMLLNMGPKALLGEHEKSGECTSFLELLEEGRQSARASPSSALPTARPVHARLCCPIRRSASSPAFGVLTSVSSRRRFDEDDENLFFDGATIIASMLSRCADYAALQTAFARGGLHQMLPAQSVSDASPIVEPRHQLAYRVDTSASRSAQSLRIPCDSGKTVKLREGSPVESVFSHMERVQNSWLSAVQLNVHLKRICDEKEEYINALLSRAKSERARPSSNAATERVAAGDS